jgi:hypothetical protein
MISSAVLAFKGGDGAVMPPPAPPVQAQTAAQASVLPLDPLRVKQKLIPAAGLDRGVLIIGMLPDSRANLCGSVDD